MTDLVPRYDNSSISSAMTRNAIALNNTAKATNDTAHNLAAESTVAGRPRHTFQSVWYSYMGGEAAGLLENNVQYYIRGVGAPVESLVDTHLALLGDSSFLLVQDPEENTYYTRVGSFQLNSKNELENHFGMKLVYVPAVNGVLPTNLETATFKTLDFSDISSAAEQTSEIKFSCGLNAKVGDSVTRAVTVHDSSGTPRTLNYVFTRNADWASSSGSGQSWALTVQAPAGCTVNGAYSAGTPSNSSAAQPVIINFNDKGSPLSFNGEATAPNIHITCPEDATITSEMKLGTVGKSDGIMVIKSGSSRLKIQANGHSAGTFKSPQIDENGNIYASFNNGQRELVGRIIVGRFNNPNGLEMLDKGLYLPNNNVQKIGTHEYSVGSGLPIYHYLGDGAAGKVAVGALESSTIETIPQMAEMVQRVQQFNNMTTSFNSLSEVADLINSIK